VAVGPQFWSGIASLRGSILEFHSWGIRITQQNWEEVMENITAMLASSDEQLLTAADAATVDFRDSVAPSIVLGEPCDI
jgi:hypothetical protein